MDKQIQANYNNNKLVESPLVSFCLFAYNQETFVREAIIAALSQTYQPLEIIISDDCSTDRTYEIIENTIENFNCNHQIVLNKNTANIGIAKHVNKVLEMAQGELIVLAAGDDISEDNRTHELVQYWLTNNKKHDSIWSAVTLIDEYGNVTGEIRSPLSETTIERQIKKMVPSLIGSAHATTKRLFQQYGPLHDDVVYEDRVLAFRSLCSGGLLYLDKKLVKYRVHSDSISSKYNTDNVSRVSEEYLRCKVINLSRQQAVFNNYKSDFKKINKQMFTEITLRKIDNEISNSLKNISIELLLYSESFLIRLKGFCFSVLRFRISLKKRIQYLACLIDPRICVDDYRKKY